MGVPATTSVICLAVSASVVIVPQWHGRPFSGADVTLAVGFLFAALVAPIMGNVTQIHMLKDWFSLTAEQRQDLKAVRSDLSGMNQEKRDGERLGEEPLSTSQQELITQVEARVLKLQGAGVTLDAENYLRLARQRKRLGNYAAAEEAYLKAWTLKSNDPWPLTQAGVIRSKYFGDHAAADALYRQALALDPDFLPAIYNTACNAARRGDAATALDMLERAIRGDGEKYRALAARDAEVVFLSLRDDPRFRAALQRS